MQDVKDNFFKNQNESVLKGSAKQYLRNVLGVGRTICIWKSSRTGKGTKILIYLMN